MEVKINLKSIAENLFKPCYYQYIQPWLESATKAEIKGLKVLQSIIKHKGTKRFKPYEKPKRNDYNTVEADMRHRTMQSYYTSQYSSLSPERTHESEILNYKRFPELKYATVLKDHNISIVEKWIALNDDIQFRDLMIICLQGFNSVCKINENMPVTTTQDNFYWYSKEERSRSNLPISIAKVASPGFKTTPRTHKSSSVEMKTQEISRSFIEPKYFQDKMIRKMRGSGDFVSWVYDKNSSMYQNAFASRINNCPAQVSKPLNSSTIIRILPIDKVNR